MDGKLYKITNPEKITGYEGQNVEVTGSLDPAAGKITIDSLAIA